MKYLLFFLLIFSFRQMALAQEDAEGYACDGVLIKPEPEPPEIPASGYHVTLLFFEDDTLGVGVDWEPDIVLVKKVSRANQTFYETPKSAGHFTTGLWTKATDTETGTFELKTLSHDGDIVTMYSCVLR